LKRRRALFKKFLNHDHEDENPLMIYKLCNDLLTFFFVVRTAIIQLPLMLVTLVS
jgi:hypothetical protein